MAMRAKHTTNPSLGSESFLNHRLQLGYQKATMATAMQHAARRYPLRKECLPVRESAVAGAFVSIAQCANIQGERREAAAADARFASELKGCLPFAPPCGFGA